MIVKPKIRGFVCVTSHPEGCAAHVKEQIAHVKAQGPIEGGPKKVLIVGASTGYGLSSRITAAFGSNADTLGVFFERPSTKGRPATAGFYNSIAFEKEAHAAGLYAKSINGDAFSNEIREQALQMIKDDLGKIDMVIYSLASPRREDPKTGNVYKSVLKPVGTPFKAKSLDTDKNQIVDVELEPATEDDLLNTQKVMGGEDWALWINALKEADLLAENAMTVAYSYIGPEITFPIYHNGTIGKAKEHLETTAKAINEDLGIEAYVSVNKAVVTQASSAIPVVPLYTSILLKVMKEKNVNEGCIEQIYRMFADKIYNGQDVLVDDKGRIRVDDLEMAEDVQSAVKAIWPEVHSDNLYEKTDYAGYQREFLKLFGFGLDGVDYEADVDVELELSK